MRKVIMEIMERRIPANSLVDGGAGDRYRC